MGDDAQMPAGSGKASEFGAGVVGRAVVDVDDLERANACERSFDLADERCQISGFVAHRHHDGDARRNTEFRIVKLS